MIQWIVGSLFNCDLYSLLHVEEVFWIKSPVLYFPFKLCLQKHKDTILCSG